MILIVGLEIFSRAHLPSVCLLHLENYFYKRHTGNLSSYCECFLVYSRMLSSISYIIPVYQVDKLSLSCDLTIYLQLCVTIRCIGYKWYPLICKWTQRKRPSSSTDDLSGDLTDVLMVLMTGHRFRQKRRAPTHLHHLASALLHFPSLLFCLHWTQHAFSSPLKEAVHG